MAFSIGDKVTLAAARGGHIAFVTDLIGGPDGNPLYRVMGPEFGDPDKAGVAADLGGDLYTVTVDVVMNKHLTVTRIHTVPAWRLGIENGG